MKLMVAGLNYAPESTGVAPYTSGLSEGLAERGHAVEVLTSFPHYPAWRLEPVNRRRLGLAETLGGVTVRRARHYVPRRPHGLGRALSEVSFGLSVTTRPWRRPDVVVTVNPALLASAMAIGRAGWGPGPAPAVGVVVQDIYSAGMKENSAASSPAIGAIGRIEAWTLRRADGVAVIHERFKRWLTERLSVDPDRITVIRNWTHVDVPAEFDRRRCRDELGWRDDEFVVLHTGAMGAKQDLLNVVEAARLAAKQSRGVRFVLAGDGGQRDVVAAAAADVAGLEIRPPVPESDYPRLLRCADLLLVNERPGLVDMAVPSKLTSYFSSGMPVLAATDARSTTAEEIASAGAGVRVDPGDPRRLLEAVEAVRDDARQRAALGAAGPRYCDRLLSQGRALDAYENWLEGLVERKRSRSTA